MGERAKDLGNRAEDLGHRAEDSTWVDSAERFGLVIYGLVYLMVAWLMVQLAFGEHSGKVDTEGALKEVAEQPLGHTMLVIAGVGMFLLLGSRLLDLFAGHRDESGTTLWRHRATDALRGVVNGVLGVKALSLATGSSSSGGTRVLTARLMDLPGGRFLVGVIGVVVIGYGCFSIWQALSEKHSKQLAEEGKRGSAGKAYLLLGKVGNCAKGAVMGLVGVLFLYAAIAHQAKKSGGIDGAIRQILHQPFGTPLLAVVGAGIACYALFSLVRARHLSR